jgi:hypothetical protein
MSRREDREDHDVMSSGVVFEISLYYYDIYSVEGGRATTLGQIMSLQGRQYAQ